MDEVRELVLVLTELVGQWVGPELVFCWVFGEGGLASVTERVTGGRGC